MTEEQKFFLENVKIIMSPQEKDLYVVHITNYLNNIKVKNQKLYKPNHLKQGDYSFVILGKDYRDEFLIERKFGLEEVYACVVASNKMTKRKEEISEEELRNNLEYEFARMCEIGVKEKWLFIEKCKSFESIKEWVSGYEQKNINAGKTIYTTLSSWCCANRFNFKIECIEDKKKFAPIMITKMFYYFRNDMKNLYGDKWLKEVKNKILEE